MNRVITGLVVTLIVAGGGGAVYLYYTEQQTRNQETLTPVSVAYRHLIEEVKISGTTEAAQTVDLAFKRGGVIDTVPVVIGQEVATGTVLMTLDRSALNNQLVQARANLDAHMASLRDLKNGTRPEQIAVTQAKIASDNAALKSAQQALLDALGNAKSASDVTVRFTIDQFITNPSLSNSQLIILVPDSRLGNAILDERRQVSQMLESWGARIDALQGASAGSILAASMDMHTYLSTISRILDSLTRLFAMGDVTQSAANQSAVASARTKILLVNDALTAAEKSVSAAQSAIDVSTKQLVLEQSGATSEVIAAQQAIVASARAQVAELGDELKDQVITAPFSGIVADVPAKQGEVIVAGAPGVSLISDGPLKIEGYVPEIYYASIGVGQPALIKADAFPGVTFAGAIGLVNPVAVLRDGVPNFKVTIYFVQSDLRLRPGLTVQAFIQTADKPSVLAVPIAAVMGSGGSASVLRQSDTENKRVPVITGITSVDGYKEVVSGLSEGDIVLINETKQYRVLPN